MDSEVKVIINNSKKQIQNSKKTIEKENKIILFYENKIKKIQSVCKHKFEYDGVHECTICNYIGEL